MIKVVNLIALIVAPILLIYRFTLPPIWPPPLDWLIGTLTISVVVLILVALLIWAFRRSRQSIKPLAAWESRD